MLRPVVAVCAAVVPFVAACSGGSGGHAPNSSAAPQLPSSSLVATRWWSNSAAQAGSTIDPDHPDEAAAHLRTSPADYCGMLRATVAAGRSILPNVTANDPALLTSTKAFVAELEAVAPSSVAGSWKVLGSAVLTLVASGGDPTKVKGVDAAAVRAAASTVAADAKHSCGVDLN
jgi:hypothetical protein